MQETKELPKERVSFSSLNWLEESPAYFQGMINGDLQREESSSMDFGKALHCYVLRKNDFNSEYYVMDATQPINEQQRKFCKNITSGIDFKEAYGLSYSIKGKSSTVIENESTKLYMTLKPYCDAIKDVGERKIISTDDYSKITNLSDNIYKHKGVLNVFNYPEKHKDAKVFVEKDFLCKIRRLHDNKDLYINGFIDYLIFDPSNRKMIITELKSSSHSLKNYRESFDKYNVGRQLAIYTIAAGKLFEELYPDIPLKEVTPEWYVIVGQTNTLFEVKCFSINEFTIQEGMMEYKDLVNRYVFHHENGWDYPQEYYTNNGVEYL